MKENNSDQQDQPDQAGNQIRRLHIFLMGKGGVGKSFVASLAMQFYRQNGTAVKGYDLDPVNKTLGNIEALNAVKFEVLKAQDPPVVDRTRFDDLIEEILKGNTDVIIDTGATTFMPINSYLYDMGLLPALKEYGIETVLHVVLRGGSSTLDCMGGLINIVNNYPEGDCRIVVWKNEVEGPIVLDGEEFEQLPYYKENRSRFSHVVPIREILDDLVINDIRELLSNRMTFKEAIASDDTHFVRRLRYQRSQDIFMDMMEPVFREYQSQAKPIS